jgi:hypothetical protein
MDIIRTANGWNLSVVGIGGRVVYVQQEVEGARPKFVAVFKYNRPATNARAFVKFLVKNFTPAEYFARMEAGHARCRSSPPTATSPRTSVPPWR